VGCAARRREAERIDPTYALVGSNLAQARTSRRTELERRAQQAAQQQAAAQQAAAQQQAAQQAAAQQQAAQQQAAREQAAREQAAREQAAKQRRIGLGLKPTASEQECEKAEVKKQKKAGAKFRVDGAGTAAANGYYREDGALLAMHAAWVRIIL
jgi:hypothetical protein